MKYYWPDSMFKKVNFELVTYSASRDPQIWNCFFTRHIYFTENSQVWI